mgnify:CR=1 FL=1
MKANEFVKKFGLDLAKRDVRALESGFIKREDILEHYGFDILDDLKRLVESHELVESRGGLDAAKHELILLQKHLNNTFGYVTIITSEKIENLKQAIADVESCQ